MRALNLTDMRALYKQMDMRYDYKSANEVKRAIEKAKRTGRTAATAGSSGGGSAQETATSAGAAVELSDDLDEFLGKAGLMQWKVRATLLPAAAVTSAAPCLGTRR